MVLFPYNTTDFAFTLEDVFLNFSTELEDTYFSVEITILYYNFFSVIEKTKVLEYKIPLFNAAQKENVGRKIHRYLSEQSKYYNLFGLVQRAAKVSFLINEVNSIDDTIEDTITLDNVVFIAGPKPKILTDKIGLLSNNTNFERVTQNGLFLVNFLLRTGNHTLKIKKNELEVFTETITVTLTNNIFSKKIIVKDFSGTKGDVFEVSIAETNIKKTFVVFPDNISTKQLVFQDSFKLSRSLECTGHFSFPDKFNQITHNYKRNLVEVLEIIETEQVNSFKINTGWVLKTDTETIAALLLSKKVFLVGNNNQVLEMVPIAKKLTKEDSEAELYEYDLEFQINSKKQMHKLIHPKFEFDLTPYSVSTVEENYWFTDQFFTKYSFPGTFILEGELLKVFGELLDDNVKFIETIFDVQYAFGNQLETAIFEIENQIGKSVEFTFRYGFDEFPNWDKDLSELPLETIEITDIFAHAPTIVNKKWPEVNYNYPQIYTDKYDTNEATWSAFIGKINNYDSGVFSTNTIVADVITNRNIIQPIPYLLHILKQGFLDAGYILKGDILTNEIVKKILIFTDIDYFDVLGSSQDFQLMLIDYDSKDSEDFGLFERTIVLEPDSSYTITGTFFARGEFPPREATQSTPASRVGYTNVSYKGDFLGGVVTQNWISEVSREVNIEFETDSDTDPTTQILNLYSDVFVEQAYDDEFVFNIKIAKTISDESDFIVIKNEVNLKNVVPNRTFGTFADEWIKFLNLDLNIVKKDVYLNFIDNSINYKNAIDLSNKEILEPKRVFNKLDSILLNFTNISDSKNSYKPVFVNKEGVKFNENDVNDETELIEVDILPLAQKSMFGLESAYFDDNGGDSKIYALLYDGLQGGKNISVDVSPILMPSIYLLFHQKWFSFRLFAIVYSWLFKMYYEEVREINKKIFAYGRYHVVKTIDKTQIGEDLFEVEIETATLP